jgi:hypothetical protein
MKRRRPTLTGVYQNLRPEAQAAKIESPGRPDRVGRVTMLFWTTATAKKQLRLIAAEEETTQQALLTEALNGLFKSRGKPPVA